MSSGPSTKKPQPEYRQKEIDKYIWLFEKPRPKYHGRSVSYGNLPPWRQAILEGYYSKVRKAGGSKVLDVGCGRGESIGIGSKLGIQVTGAEVVPKLCADSSVTLVPGAHDLPFKDNSFDALSCLDVLEHIPEQDVDLVFKELARVAPGAVIGISRRESAWRRDEKPFVLHITVKSEQWWMEKLAKAFRHVALYPYKNHPEKNDEYLVVRCESPS